MVIAAAGVGQRRLCLGQLQLHTAAGEGGHRHGRTGQVLLRQLALQGVAAHGGLPSGAAGVGQSIAAAAGVRQSDLRTGQVGGGRCEALHLGQQGQQAAAAALLGTGEDGAGAAGGFVGLGGAVAEGQVRGCLLRQSGAITIHPLLLLPDGAAAQADGEYGERRGQQSHTGEDPALG